MTNESAPVFKAAQQAESDPAVTPDWAGAGTRPFHPQGSEIMAQAFDAYAAWESKWCEDLEEIDDPLTRSTVYGHMMAGIDIDLAKAMALRQGQSR